jgi:hypothetical protein
VSAGSHDSHPAVWTTSDGRLWTTIDLALPVKGYGTAGGASSAVLRQIAINGSHVVALGQEITAGGSVPFAEQSSDGGVTWTQNQVSGLSGGTDAITALTSSGPAVTGVGSTAAMTGRGFLLLALPPA